MGFVQKLLKTVSGASKMEVSAQLVYDKVIGFRSIVPGCGASTIVFNVAEALSATTKYSICVLDPSFMYASQYSNFITADYLVDHKKDLLDYNIDLDEILFQTTTKNVYLVAMKDRGLIDMLSAKDTESMITKVITALKNYFDIILIDIPLEPSYLATYAAIKCNKIINVAEPSLKCVKNLQKSINTMCSLGVTFVKADRVVLNKMPVSLTVDVAKAFESMNFNILGSIPLSDKIAMHGVSGKKVWGTASTDKAIKDFNFVIDAVLDSILKKTLLNEKNYIGAVEVKQNLDQYNAKDNVLIEEEDDGDDIISEDFEVKDSNGLTIIEKVTKTDEKSSVVESKEKIKNKFFKKKGV